MAMPQSEQRMHLLAEKFGDLLHKCQGRNASRALYLFDLYMNHQHELQSYPSLGNGLVSVLADFGYMSQAHYVFSNLSCREEITWNSLIMGYAKHGDSHEAFTVYHRMVKDNLNPSIPTFLALLKACVALKDLAKGCKLHDNMLTLGLIDGDIFITGSLIVMYAKCGSVKRAHDLLIKLPVRDVVLWTALITGYIDYGYAKEAFLCFEQMENEGISCDVLTLVSILKACVILGSITRGQEIHATVVNKGLEREPLIGNSLLDMYAKCGSLIATQYVFSMLIDRNVVSWTALIDGYVENGCCPKALDCFEKMHYDGSLANVVTFMCILKACTNIRAESRGQEIHIVIVKRGFTGDNVVANGLVNMYAKCGMFLEAQNVFEKLLVPTVAACNALMGGYSEHGHAKEALHCFEWMQYEGMVMNAITFVCILKACGDLGTSTKGLEVHDEITKKGMETEAHMGSALSDMYAKCGLLGDAQVLFDQLQEIDVVSWTALITGYVEHGYMDRTLECYKEMQCEGILMNTRTFVSILKAYGSIGAIEKAQETHGDVVKKGSEGDNLVIGTLVHTYAKCGSCEEAKYVFDKLVVQDEVCWNAILAAYAQVGESQNVFQLFNQMLEECRKPDLVTFISVLNACSHAGEVWNGEKHFEAIAREYDLLPVAEHYACMIDLLGRSGCIEKVIVMLKDIPMQPNKMVWLTMLGACRKWGYVNLGRCAFEHVLQLDAKDGSAYICMANIYTEAEMQDEAMRIETMGVENQASLKSRQHMTNISPQCFAFLLE